MCRIPWWCSLFLFHTGNILFGKRRETKRDYRLCDFTRAETLKQADVVNTAFLFCSGECVCGLFFGTALKTLINLTLICMKYFCNVTA